MAFILVKKLMIPTLISCYGSRLHLQTVCSGTYLKFDHIKKHNRLPIRPYDICAYHRFFSFSDQIEVWFNFFLFFSSAGLLSISAFYFSFSISILFFPTHTQCAFLFSDSFRTPVFLFAINMMTGIEEKQKHDPKLCSFKLKSPVFLCAINMMTEMSVKQKKPTKTKSFRSGKRSVFVESYSVFISQSNTVKFL